jgi:GrpB-like predicted nucleotidyltransferase (UPF0157 family)
MSRRSAMRMGEPALIGGLEPRDIRIVDYDPVWPARFQEQRRIIAGALGNSLLRIEHIGSTAVPGLAAKPIVDILIVVADSADEPSYLPCLVTAGYELRVREPDLHQHRMLRTPARDVHVHVWPPDAPEIARLLGFRDRLRSNADDRKRYEDTKRRLAALSWPDMNAYAEAKTGVIEAILASR